MTPDAPRQRLADALAACDRRLRNMHAAAGELRARIDEAERELASLDSELVAAGEELRGFGHDPFAWGDFARVEPLSDFWGADRGRCVDRYFIEQFIESHASDVRGRVLEVHDSDYTIRFGAGRVVQSDVLDIDPTNPRATIVGDLRRLGGVASGSYDCFIMTQTLHGIYDIRAVLRECARIVKPGGALLATLPFASRLAPEQGLDGDFWRFTTAAALRLFAEHFDADDVEVQSYGNALVNIAFLYGLACHELRDDEFDAEDPFSPLIIGVRARRRPAEGLEHGPV
jgi:hypothetical protein